MLQKILKKQTCKNQVDILKNVKPQKKKKNIKYNEINMSSIDVISAMLQLHMWAGSVQLQ
jgi:ribosomal protein L18E